jgi:hypothetical protein
MPIANNNSLILFTEIIWGYEWFQASVTFARLGFYEAKNGSFLTRLPGKLSVPSSGLSSPVGHVCYPETQMKARTLWQRDFYTQAVVQRRLIHCALMLLKKQNENLGWIQLAQERMQWNCLTFVFLKIRKFFSPRSKVTSLSNGICSTNLERQTFRSFTKRNRSSNTKQHFLD